MSKRIRHGYRPTPLWSKFLMRYNLLCDSCNWEFVGFAVPGTVSHKPTKKAKTKASAGPDTGEKNGPKNEDGKSSEILETIPLVKK